MCTTGMAGAFEGQEKVLDPLELEVWVSCKMPCGWGAGNGTQTLLGMHQVVLTTVIFPARVCRYLHMIAGAHRDLWHQIPLKLGMQAVLSQPMWCWEPNSVLLARVVCTPNCCALSPNILLLNFHGSF